ncbi:KdsC family phosphatase [Leptolyngbya sp. NIES-2104]|uniref:KdsC family phosphatase n=1 Tax=Leptolyngbya sp. NIES-2104 TaxID=1552121 RepID=UPI0006EC5480|nr:HAD-IIIA family hydrolase [Leptolyngbya sp. NIES-2104]GAP97603.1 3-deoxy-D-manno-octulosonate 8-phosphate phosphatase [Leptolyngbya sp. NIES-2104]
MQIDELRSRLAQIKLLALDVDGTLTDGGLYFTNSGDEFKKFNVKDGQGMKLVMEAGIQIAILSASSSTATIHRAKKLGISHVYVGVEDKLTILRSLCDQLGIDFSQVAYVGDDVNDLPILEAVGCPLTVADAVKAAKQAAIYITEKAGGQGAVREICDLLLESQMP